MANPKKNIQTYSLIDVGRMCGIPKSTINHIVEKRQFDRIPFTVIQIANRFVCPKKQVDKFFEEGKLPNFNKQKTVGRPKKWYTGEYKTYNFPVPMTLHEDFMEVVNRLNKTTSLSLTKRDYIYVAMQEFIDRRPGDMGDGR